MREKVFISIHKNKKIKPLFKVGISPYDYELIDTELRPFVKSNSLAKHEIAIDLAKYIVREYHNKFEHGEVVSRKKPHKILFRIDEEEKNKFNEKARSHGYKPNDYFQKLLKLFIREKLSNGENDHL